jgi:hypothetical protein
MTSQTVNRKRGITMRRTITALVSAFILLLLTAAPASATDYGRPYGRWLQAIVSHEAGHCLGWWKDGIVGYPSIMRSSLSPTYINSGSHTYTPTSTDLARMQASRADSVAGEDNTYYVNWPFHRDYVPVYNRTGVSAAFTAVDRWDYGTDLNIAPVTYEPAWGITIQWSSARAGTSVGGWVGAATTHNGSFEQIIDCTIYINTRVVR